MNGANDNAPISGIISQETQDLLRGFAKIAGSGATYRAPEIVPAETLQAEQPTNPSRRGKLVVWALWVTAIALVGCHPIWVAAGMPVPVFLSPVLEILTDV